MAVTVGLLAVLGIDALLEGLELAGQGSAGLRAARRWSVSVRSIAYLVLSGVSAWMADRRAAAKDAGASPVDARTARGHRHRAAQPRGGAGDRLGLRDRVARAGRLPRGRLRAAQHDRGPGDRGTDRREGRVAAAADRPAVCSPAGPAVLGAWIGAAAFNASLAAFLFGRASARSRRCASSWRRHCVTSTGGCCIRVPWQACSPGWRSCSAPACW